MDLNGKILYVGNLDQIVVMDCDNKYIIYRFVDEKKEHRTKIYSNAKSRFVKILGYNVYIDK